jgi:2-oxoisovalerate dehydrogenase E1 component alpha subunit
MQNSGVVCLVYFGDGASSQGETHEAMNFAGVHRLPVVFICENNRYAISVPQSSQMAITDVANRADGYGFPGVVVDGMDLLAVYQATSEAIRRSRQEGPALLELKLDRFMPHTTDDDDRRYRPADEVENARRRDPVVSLADLLVEQGLLTRERIEEIGAEARRAIDEATDAADAALPPDASTMLDHLFVE